MVCQKDKNPNSTPSFSPKQFNNLIEKNIKIDVRLDDKSFLKLKNDIYYYIKNFTIDCIDYKINFKEKWTPRECMCMLNFLKINKYKNFKTFRGYKITLLDLNIF